MLDLTQNSSKDIRFLVIKLQNFKLTCFLVEYYLFFFPKAGEVTTKHFSFPVN